MKISAATLFPPRAKRRVGHSRHFLASASTHPAPARTGLRSASLSSASGKEGKHIYVQLSTQRYSKSDRPELCGLPGLLTDNFYNFNC